MVYSRKAIGTTVVDERAYLYDGLDCIAEVRLDGVVL